METLKLKLHSSVDLITNSSRVIFTYSEGSVSKLKELVNEILKMFDQTLIFDDVFNAETFCENDVYSDSEEYPLESDVEFLELKEKILKGELKKPDWMKEIEEDEGYYGYSKSTYLEIYPKNKKYEELSKKIINFLYSTDNEATRDG